MKDGPTAVGMSLFRRAAAPPTPARYQRPRLPEGWAPRAAGIISGIPIGQPRHFWGAAIFASAASRISGNVGRSMTGIASRVAKTDDPEAKPSLNPASSTDRAPRPSPQLGTTCNAGSFNNAFMAAAFGRSL